jgi:hypothetical protein
MKNENDNLENIFQKHQNNWDIQELNSNHNEMFLIKLHNKKPKQNYFIPFAIAASLLLIAGISFLYNSNQEPKKLQFASEETQQTDSIFTVLIEKELIKIKEKKSPENEIIIQDALKQMKTLDIDYQNIIQELKNNGENKSIIMALITNLQTRISFLQNVLQHIEQNEKIKELSDEKVI